MGKLVCWSKKGGLLHLIWVSQSVIIRAEQRLTRARGQDGTALRNCTSTEGRGGGGGGHPDHNNTPPQAFISHIIDTGCTTPSAFQEQLHINVLRWPLTLFPSSVVSFLSFFSFFFFYLFFFCTLLYLSLPPSFMFQLNWKHEYYEAITCSCLYLSLSRTKSTNQHLWNSQIHFYSFII